MLPLDYKQFVLAREYRGLSQSDLAGKIEGLSQSNLSKFEKGLLPLSEAVLSSIISYLNFPMEFFGKRIYNTIQNAHYRKKSSVSKKLERNIDINLKFIGLIVDEISTIVEWPAYKLKSFDLLEGYSVESAANHTRRILGLLPDTPVYNIVTSLEEAGVIIVEFNPSPDFDGVSFFTDLGYPVIVVNSSFSNDRKRFTIAHELGHLVLHLADYIFVQDSRNKEEEAHAFASEFLMPAIVIKPQLTNLKLSDLLSLKSFWATSMGAIIRRAYDLKVIDQKKYTYFNIEFSRYGWRKNEPGEVQIDTPKAFKFAFQLIKNHYNYTDEDVANSFGLPIEVIKKFFNSDLSQKSKLRLVI